MCAIFWNGKYFQNMRKGKAFMDIELSKKADSLQIVMYHYIRDLKHSRYPGIKGMDVSLFRKQIRFFHEAFKIVTMEEVIAAVKGQCDLPDNALLLTFDDGYIDNYTFVMPILEEESAQGAFFIPGKTFAEHKLLDVNKIHYILACAKQEDILKDLFDKMNYYRGSEFEFQSNEELFAEYALKEERYDSQETVFIKCMLQTVLPERLRNRITSELLEKYVGVSEEKLAYELYMTEEQIRALKRHGMYIGIHGYDHYWLSDLPEQQMRSDIDKALQTMGEFMDQKEWVMNYPYGSYNQSVIKYISGCGCCMGLTTEVRTADIHRDNRFCFPRLDCNDFPPKSENFKYIIRHK